MQVNHQNAFERLDTNANQVLAIAYYSEEARLFGAALPTVTGGKQVAVNPLERYSADRAGRRFA